MEEIRKQKLKNLNNREVIINEKNIIKITGISFDIGSITNSYNGDYTGGRQQLLNNY